MGQLRDGGFPHGTGLSAVPLTKEFLSFKDSIPRSFEYLFELNTLS